jgi:hypothetical protein
MPTASFNKYNQSAEVLVEGINAGTDTWRIILSNTAPDVTDTNQASASELTTAGGYTVNGNQATMSSSSQSGGVYKLVLNSPTAWTGSGGGFTARYAILWDQTTDQLVGWWDYGSSQAVAAGETFTVSLDGTNGVFQVS